MMEISIARSKCYLYFTNCGWPTVFSEGVFKVSTRLFHDGWIRGDKFMILWFCPFASHGYLRHVILLCLALSGWLWLRIQVHDLVAPPFWQQWLVALLGWLGYLSLLYQLLPGWVGQWRQVYSLVVLPGSAAVGHGEGKCFFQGTTASAPLTLQAVAWKLQSNFFTATAFPGALMGPEPLRPPCLSFYPSCLPCSSLLHLQTFLRFFQMFLCVEQGILFWVIGDLQIEGQKQRHLLNTKFIRLMVLIPSISTIFFSLSNHLSKM